MKSQVAIAKATTAQEMVKTALDLLGGVEKCIPSGMTIVLKPNAGHEGGPETAINTSPEFLRAVIQEVKKTNPKSIIIAEASAVGCKTIDCLESSGIAKVAREEGVDQLIDIKSYKNLVTQAVDNPTCSITHVDLPDFLLNEGHYFINLPIFKSHTSMVFSCALKNLKGVVQDKHHVVMHTTNLAGAVADLGSVVQPDLTIVDMINPMEGYGPHAGTPIHIGCVLAGKDMVALDATACRIAELPIEKIDYFGAVAKRGLGVYKEEEIEILGTPIKDVKKKLWMPYLEGFEAFPEYDVHVGMACSTCQGLTSFNLVRMKSLGYYEKCAGTQVIVGSYKGRKIPEGVDLDQPVHLMGRCAMGLKATIEAEGGTAYATPGCPPVEPLLSWNIMDGKENTIGNLYGEKNPIKRLGVALKLVLARLRMKKETKPFMNWLKNQER
ncbi:MULTISPECIES: DUF362 domain-containing protein [unclassified Fusibacter]|uniref:DUF362 domain-containing protein n=1 Tax=unclassified Fusibacter TaxID=2624464 RepID=UPI00101041FA|nr:MULTISPECIES: DUF362 domain-containing protein [unclassified Fusibacter]MCK8060618.1 DUF362 domain-containing protein [Fusibacter sp. A2]NPE22928.1 DUF362 domain-containing protein [Fusibacter sp. A1]RXV59995.1 DUF362 domain-containing protein [Fusibacter sp. A1]